MRFLANRRTASAALLAAALFLFSCGESEDNGPRATPSPTPVAIADRIAQSPTEGLPVDGTFIGDPDAPILIEMYEDFGCPHCLDFTANIEPHLLEAYVEPGDVRLQYRFFPLRQITANAAIAALCAAEQDQFWPFHKELFIAQAHANGGTGPPLSEAFDTANLRTLATSLELDVGAFDTCTMSDAVIEKITADLRTATELGLPGTPSFIINGEVLATVPESREGWSELLDGLIAD